MPDGMIDGGDPHYTYKLNWLAAQRDTAERWLRSDPAAQIAREERKGKAPSDHVPVLVDLRRE